ncbi:hypothetical protein MHL30_19900 [Priestia flexa]|uniref:hypothetical protein n=1 Tax=Priestia flexa TaxID=86664 RepID=UPI001EF47B7D|nr:hypothetical protein [Priestia flexa]MCG7315356.1 hypothetical protein [Priestia flexa]
MPKLAPAGPALAQQTVRETLQNVKQQAMQMITPIYNPKVKRYQDPETGRFVANPNVERVEKPVGVEKKAKEVELVRNVESVQDVSKGTGNGITKDEYKNLRKKTPSNDVRKMVNPDGPKVDPVYGYEVDKFEADHIVSMKEITEMDGFGRLTREQQIEILNLKDNFVGLGKSSNASKGAHSWADWKGHSKMGEVPVNVRMEMLEKEKQARESLKIAIEERLKK